MRKIGITIGVGISLFSSAMIQLTAADRRLLLLMLGFGLLIICWETAPIIAGSVRPRSYRPKGKKMLPILVMIIGAMVFAAGAVWFYVEHPISMTGVNNPSGGEGGKAKADRGGGAKGGKGGAAGDLGPGGRGGDAAAIGKGSFALGGEGGEGGRSDRAAKGGRGPLDVLGDPRADMIVPGTGMRLGDFGRGGDGAAPPVKKR